VAPIFNSVSNEWAIDRHKFAREALKCIIEQYQSEKGLAEDDLDTEGIYKSILLFIYLHYFFKLSDSLC
jgi:hypothetical protein